MAYFQSKLRLKCNKIFKYFCDNQDYFTAKLVDSDTSPNACPDLEVITKEMRISITKNEIFSVFSPQIFMTLPQQKTDINIFVL